jgi:hypothetical protein
LNLKPEAVEDSSGDDDDEAAEAPVAAAATAAMAGADASHERILALHKELAESLGPRTEAIVLKRLTDLLTQPQSVAKGVALMELLGKDIADSLYARLNSGCRDAILQFLSDGNYGRPKADLMLEVGEELKTKLLGEKFGSIRGELTIKMAEAMLQLDQADIVVISQIVPSMLRPRWFLYLEPEALARTISAINKSKPAQVQEVLEAVPRIVDFERQTELDDQLVQVIQDHVRSKNTDETAKYMKYYQKMLEALDGNLADTAVELFSAVKPTLKSQLSVFVVTFKTLFKIPASVRKELLEPLGNKPLAALLLGAEPALHADILGCVSERRHEMIKDELEVLKGAPAREGAAAFEQAKDSVIIAMKKLRDSGELEKYLSEGDAPPPAVAA